MILHGVRLATTRPLFTLGNVVTKKITTCRFIHIASGRKCVPIRTTFNHDFYKRINVLGAISIRHNSNVLVEPLPSVPEPPLPLPEVADVVLQLHANGDPTFSSIGLGGYGPIGLMQYFIEALHVYGHLPWWATIMTVSLCLKVVLFKYYVNGQKLQVVSHNHSPHLQAIQKRMMQEQISGNLMEASVLMNEQQTFMKKHGISPAKTLLNSAIQGGTSVIAFFALRGILLSDLESLKIGGYSWFFDLTIADSYYILPIATCVSMALLTEVMLASNTFQGGIWKYGIRAIPFATLPIMINFSSGLQLFWFTTNVLTVLQYGLVQIPVVKKALKIPEKKMLLKPGGGFMGNVNQWKEIQTLKKESYKVGQYEDHLLKAARSPVVKTFKYNPKEKVHLSEKENMKTG